MIKEEPNLLTLIVPGVVTIFGNVIFYLWIKRRTDKQIEKFKISYSGVFKEKIDVHKAILEKSFRLKKKVQAFQYFNQNDEFTAIQRDFNDFIEFYKVNRPFIKDVILKDLERFTKELQNCFEAFAMKSNDIKEADLDLKKAQEKIRRNNPFEYMENKIVQEIKAELDID